MDHGPKTGQVLILRLYPRIKYWDAGDGIINYTYTCFRTREVTETASVTALTISLVLLLAALASPVLAIA